MKLERKPAAVHEPPPGVKEMLLRSARGDFFILSLYVCHSGILHTLSPDKAPASAPFGVARQPRRDTSPRARGRRRDRDLLANPLSRVGELRARFRRRAGHGRRRAEDELVETRAVRPQQLAVVEAQRVQLRRKPGASRAFVRSPGVLP